MPRTALTAGAHRESQVDRFDQLVLERGTGHRVWVPNEDFAWMELVHNVRAPVFDEKDKPLKAQKKVRGGFKEVFDMDEGWLGSPICPGDPKVVEKNELDADGCPTCAGVKRLLDAGISDARDLLPQRRYAVPVIRYETQSKSDPAKGLRQPYNAKVLVWRLSQWSWEQVDRVRPQMAPLVGKSDPAEVKLQMTDLVVSNENGFQKIDKIYPLPCAWRADTDEGREVRKMVLVLWKREENRPTEAQLRAACGREPNRDWMTRDIEDAEFRWRKAVFGVQSGPTGDGALSNGTGQDLAGDLEDLLTDDPAADPLAGHPGGLDEFASRTPAAPAASADEDIFGADAPAPAPAPAAPAADEDLFDDSAPATAVPAVKAPAASAPAPAAEADLLGSEVPAPAADAKAGEFENFDDIFENV
jgi:hypothetical protein